MSVICYHTAAVVADEESYRNPLDGTQTGVLQSLEDKNKNNNKNKN